MTFAELAKQEYQAVLAENEEARRESERKQIERYIAKTLEFFKKNQLDAERAVINRETAVVELDGIRMSGLCLVGVCPDCGQETLSEPLH